MGGNLKRKLEDIVLGREEKTVTKHMGMQVNSAMWLVK